MYVFRPLTGKLVLIVPSATLRMLHFSLHFRPLTGKLVLIIARAIRVPYPVRLISVPLRGSWF